MEKTPIPMDNSHDALPLRMFRSRSAGLSQQTDKSVPQTLIMDRSRQRLVAEPHLYKVTAPWRQGAVVFCGGSDALIVQVAVY